MVHAIFMTSLEVTAWASKELKDTPAAALSDPLQDQTTQKPAGPVQAHVSKALVIHKSN